jgi:tRNA (guanine37-N1)-methyltransferase
MHFHIITIFPEAFTSYLDSSMILRAKKAGRIKVCLYNPRDFTSDKYKQVDDRPFGGGPGMALKAEPILKAVDKAKGRKRKVKIMIMSPRGVEFTSNIARKTANDYKDLILICGHYEGIDARVKTILQAEEISIGSFVLTGGELPAMVVVDAMTRFVPGVLGKDESLEENRIASASVFTRPEVLVWKKKKYEVPKVLVSGDHKKIDKWRQEN